MRASTVWLMSSALCLSSCGAGAISTGEAASSTTGETSAGETSTSETSTSTGSPEELEPLDCSSGSCGALIIEGPFSELAGVEPDYQVSCLLEVLQTTWWPHGAEIRETIDGELHRTELFIDGMGGAIVMESDTSEVYTRVEYCELAPAEFFAACMTNFDAECANLDDWFGPCTTEGLACPSPRDCGLDPACESELELGPDGDDDPSCVWAALRDAELLDAALVVRNTYLGWYYEWYTLHLDAQSRNIGVESAYVDDASSWSFIGRCELRPAVFFQACLDAPDGDPNCKQPSTWTTGCVEQPQPCAD